MDEDSEILLRAELDDKASPGLRNLAKNTENVGDEAAEATPKLAAAADEVEDLGDEAAEAATKLRLLEKRIRELEAANKRHAKSNRELRQEQRLLNKELDATRKSGLRAIPVLGRLFSMFGGGGRKVKKTSNAMSKFFGVLKKLAGFTVKVTLLATGFAFLSRAIAGLGAAGIAAANGLAPLGGLLVAYPGYLTAIVSAFGAFKVATSGLGNAISVMRDPAATAKEIAEATKNMSQNQIQFARAVVDSDKAFIDLKKNVGDRFFDDLDDTYRNLTRRYLPVANKYLGEQAGVWNSLFKQAEKYLDTIEAQRLLEDIWKDSIYETDQFGRSLGNLGLTVAYLVRFAGPMLRRMSNDFRNFTGGLLGDTRGNEAGLTKFFNSSYDTFLGVTKTMSYYVKGLINIIDYSDALTNFIGKRLKRIGKDFLGFTESESGEKRIRKFFRDSRGTVKELGLWVRDISGALADLTMSNPDFMKASRALRETALPMIVGALDELASGVVPAVETIANLKEGGVIGGLGNVLKIFGKAIQKSSELVAALPDFAQSIVGFATTVLAGVGLYKVAKNRLGGGLLGGLAGSVAGGIQKVFVVNMLPGGGLGAGVGRGGGVVAGAARGGMLARAGGFLRAGAMRAAGPVGLLLAGIGGVVSLANYQSRKEQERNGVPTGGTDPASIVNDYDVYSRKLNEFVNSNLNTSTAGPQRIAELKGALKTLNQQMMATAGVTVNEWRNMSDAAQKNALKSIDWAEKSRKAAMRMADPFNRYSTGRNMGKEGQIASMTNTRGDVANSYKIGASDPRYQAGLNIISRAGFQNIEKFKQNALNLDKILRRLPKEAVAEIKTPGDLQSIENIMRLKREFKLTPKQVETLLKLNGSEAAQAKIERLKEKLRELDGANATASVSIGANFDANTRRLIGKGIPLDELFRFAGGATEAGRKYIAGEFGPEMWLGRNGAMKMLGMNGPELVKPGSGAVIPASATSDPWGGNTGNAPSWAISAYRQAMKAGQGVTDRPLARPQRSGGGSGGSVTINAPIGPIYATSNVDVTKAVQEGLRKAQKEAEERQ